MPGKVPDEELLRMANLTLAHYGRSAGTFWDGTKSHDVSQNYDAFLGAIDRGTRRCAFSISGADRGVTCAIFICSAIMPSDSKGVRTSLEWLALTPGARFSSRTS
jgi:hypothetical protein